MAMPKNYTDADFLAGTSNPDPIEIMVANFEETIEGLKADLRSAIAVSWAHGATEWASLNYPEYAKELEGRAGPDGNWLPSTQNREP